MRKDVYEEKVRNGEIVEMELWYDLGEYWAPVTFDDLLDYLVNKCRERLPKSLSMASAYDRGATAAIKLLKDRIDLKWFVENDPEFREWMEEGFLDDAKRDLENGIDAWIDGCGTRIIG